MFALQSEPSQGPNCWQCRYFAISWDGARPYSCKLMGFKSKAIPSLEVVRVDGQACRGFASKTTTALPPQMPLPMRAVAPVKPTRHVWEA